MAAQLQDEAFIFLQYKADTHVNHTSSDGLSLRLSSEIVEHLKTLGLEPSDVFKRPVIKADPVDDIHPIEHYFVSSSHNTYLIGRQLIGRSSAAAYTHALTCGARCVEIDAWSSPQGPVVTHGYTLTQSVSLKDVCKAISDVVTENDWPVMVSLECHVGVPEQPEMIKIMEDAWGEKLLRRQIDGLDVERVTPAALRGKILLMVEFYPPPNPDDEPLEDEHHSEPETEHTEDWSAYIFNRLGFGKSAGHQADTVKAKISDILASLGAYARSMKPSGNWLTQHVTYPVPILINISEISINAITPHSLHLLIAHANQHLRRVYPKGTRITSSNQDPVKQWRNGSQIAALNWQKYDDGMQLNEAMFVGTPGWVLKPLHMRTKTPHDAPPPESMKLVGEIVGVSALPCPKDALKFSSYVRVELLHTNSPHEWKTKTVKAKAENKESGADIMWNERFEINYESDELAFLRLTFEEAEFGGAEKLATFCAKLNHIQQGWRLVRLLDMNGKSTGATLLVNFKMERL